MGDKARFLETILNTSEQDLKRILIKCDDIGPEAKEMILEEIIKRAEESAITRTLSSLEASSK